MTEEAKKQEEKDALRQKMQEKTETLKAKIQPGRKSLYLGIFSERTPENFKESYQAFNTVRQGEAVLGFGGTCGIVASCNVVNQQTGNASGKRTAWLSSFPQSSAMWTEDSGRPAASLRRI